jgi:hypothetical protein
LPKLFACFSFPILYIGIIEKGTAMDLQGYTLCELQLMVERHKEGRVTLPAKLQREVQAEIKRRYFRGSYGLNVK